MKSRAIARAPLAASAPPGSRSSPDRRSPAELAIFADDDPPVPAAAGARFPDAIWKRRAASRGPGQPGLPDRYDAIRLTRGEKIAERLAR